MNTNQSSQLSDLSVLCITKAEPSILPLLNNLSHLRRFGAELVIVSDGKPAYNKLFEYLPCDSLIQVESAGYIESVHDSCLQYTTRRYILRLDDDESISAPMLDWLLAGKYRNQLHWKFSRIHLWADDQTTIINPPLFPDHQTRLSVRQLAGGRGIIHCGSPHGGGELAPVAILHHKFLVKSIHERQHIRQQYNQIMPNAGESFLPFSVPEDYYSGIYDLKPLPLVQAFAGVLHRMEQINAEIWPFAEWLYNRRPHNVLEIGVRHGGTSALWHGFCTGRIVGVDWEGRDGLGEETRKVHAALTLQYPRFESIIGDSHSGETIRRIDDKSDDGYDFIFIDGDHTYEGVREDFINFKCVLSRGGCIAFHDIVDTPTTRNAGQGVFKFWNKLKVWHPGKWKEFSINGEWGGLGVYTP